MSKDAGEPTEADGEDCGMPDRQPLGYVSDVGDPTPQTDRMPDGSRRFDPDTLRATIAAAFKREGET